MGYREIKRAKAVSTVYSGGTVDKVADLGEIWTRIAHSVFRRYRYGRIPAPKGR